MIKKDSAIKIKAIHLVLIILILGAAGGGVAIAFTGPSANPPSGTSKFWQLNGTNLSYTLGSVGVGLSNPSYALQISGGDLYTSGSLRAGTGICIAGSCQTSFSSVPSGMILFFNLSSCPTGWSEATSARGRYLVGLPSGGTLAGTAGTALSNLENRPVGRHTHSINDPGHSHYVFMISGPGFAGTDLDGGSNIGLSFNQNTSAQTTGITINNSGTVPGTNAPYIQLLVCQKN